MNIIVDAMGGDKAPGEIIQGCIDAVLEYDITLTLIGQEEVIREELKREMHRRINLRLYMRQK